MSSSTSTGRRSTTPYIEVAARQPDGKLVQQGEMLGQALRGLGVAEADLASSDAARAEAFQRLSAGKRS